MVSITYSSLRQHLAQVLQQVLDQRDPCVVTRRGHEDVVLVARQDWEALNETLYLLSSPENARRLEQARQQDAAGDVFPSPY
ncbi:MAG: type II toxin-antitoxin system Phd/YefM family antitoxin [Holosporales bacterium]|jgi:antitoxin YefM